VLDAPAAPDPRGVDEQDAFAVAFERSRAQYD
jgi:hypothetical protein